MDDREDRIKIANETLSALLLQGDEEALRGGNHGEKEKVYVDWPENDEYEYRFVSSRVEDYPEDLSRALSPQPFDSLDESPPIVNPDAHSTPQYRTPPKYSTPPKFSTPPKQSNVTPMPKHHREMSDEEEALLLEEELRYQSILKQRLQENLMRDQELAIPPLRLEEMERSSAYEHDHDEVLEISVRSTEPQFTNTLPQYKMPRGVAKLSDFVDSLEDRWEEGGDVEVAEAQPDEDQDIPYQRREEVQVVTPKAKPGQLLTDERHHVAESRDVRDDGVTNGYAPPREEPRVQEHHRRPSRDESRVHEDYNRPSRDKSRGYEDTRRPSRDDQPRGVEQSRVQHQEPNVIYNREPRGYQSPTRAPEPRDEGHSRAPEPRDQGHSRAPEPRDQGHSRAPESRDHGHSRAQEQPHVRTTYAQKEPPSTGGHQPRVEPPARGYEPARGQHQGDIREYDDPRGYEQSRALPRDQSHGPPRGYEPPHYEQPRDYEHVPPRGYEPSREQPRNFEHPHNYDPRDQQPRGKPRDFEPSHGSPRGYDPRAHDPHYGQPREQSRVPPRGYQPPGNYEQPRSQPLDSDRRPRDFEPARGQPRGNSRAPPLPAIPHERYPTEESYPDYNYPTYYPEPTYPGPEQYPYPLSPKHPRQQRNPIYEHYSSRTYDKAPPFEDASPEREETFDRKRRFSDSSNVKPVNNPLRQSHRSMEELYSDRRDALETHRNKQLRKPSVNYIERNKQTYGYSKKESGYAQYYNRKQEQNVSSAPGRILSRKPPLPSIKAKKTEEIDDVNPEELWAQRSKALSKRVDPKKPKRRVSETHETQAEPQKVSIDLNVNITPQGFQFSEQLMQKLTPRDGDPNYVRPYADPYVLDKAFKSNKELSLQDRTPSDLDRLVYSQTVTNPFTPLPPIQNEQPPEEEEIVTNGYLALYRKEHNIKQGVQERHYKPYSYSDYKRMQRDFKLGGLGPDIDSEGYREKVEKKIRAEEYAREVHERNMRRQAAPKASPKQKPPESNREVFTPTIVVKPSKRQAAMDYAKKLHRPSSKTKVTKPKPKPKEQPKPEPEMIDLKRLLERHERDKENVATVRAKLLEV